MLLAGRRDHPRALRRRAGRRSASSACATARAQLPRRRRRRPRSPCPARTVEDWKDCGQCRDCFNPAFNYRPRQLGAVRARDLATSTTRRAPRRFRFGFIALERQPQRAARHRLQGVRAAPDDRGRRRARRGLAPAHAGGPQAPDGASRCRSIRPTRRPACRTSRCVDFERQASFFMTGGLVAVHAEGRDRDAIWNALKRREVYGTSGERILLWFDLLNGPDGAAPMGSEVAPRRDAALPGARGRRVQAAARLPRLRVDRARRRSASQHLCRGECYNPSDERHRITRIEVVRIRPQQPPGRAGRPADRGSVAALRRARPTPTAAPSSSTIPTSSRRDRDVDLLRARHPGADAGGQRRRPALHATTTQRQLRRGAPLLRRLPHARPTTTA